MQTPTWKRMVMTAALIGLGSVWPTHAANIGGFLGTTVGATDVYGLTCPAGTRSVSAKVNDANVAGVQFSVQVLNPVGRAATASAEDSGGFSPAAVLRGRAAGAGNYLVTVSKDNNTLGEGYVVTLDCLDATGNALVIHAVLVQNQ
jgi:hypothetical protein